jgi:hypothetical protein
MSRVRSTSAAIAVLATCLLSACNVYSVEVGASRPEQLRALFLIVSSTDVYDQTNQTDPSILTEQSKVSGYLLFAQYDPAKDGSGAWVKRTLANSRVPEDLVLKVSRDRRTLTLEIQQSLAEDNGDLTAYALALGTRGWYVAEFDTTQIKRTKGIRIEPGSDNFATRLLK